MADDPCAARLLFHCIISREVLHQTGQLLRALDAQVQFDGWTPEVAANYRRLLDEIAALDFHLYAHQLMYADENAALPSDEDRARRLAQLHQSMDA